MPTLYGRWRDMSLPRGRLFSRGRASGCSAYSSVVAHPVHCGLIHNDCLVVNIRHVRHVVHGSVIEEDSIVPISALIADTGVAKAVINTPIESDLQSPVTLIEDKHAIAPAPITRSPQ